jgi:DNA-binding FadR family transcriptional regulator
MPLTFSEARGPRSVWAARTRTYVRNFPPDNGTVMMPINRLLDNAAFDPAAITALRDAYEGACAALQLADRTDPLTEVVAKRIIEHARRGERDPSRLCAVVLKELQSKR